MAAPATRLVARQSAGFRRRGRWQLEEDRMDDIRLPRHVINRLEHRWANRLQQDAKAWSGEKDRAVRSRQVQSYGPRGIPVTVRRARRAADALSFE
jgi:hypothetical protein